MLCCRVFGPHSLKSIAAAALRHNLTQKLDSLEAAQAQASSSSKGSAQGGKASCSLVCVQACSSDASEAGATAALSPLAAASSADVDLIVVQTDVSPGSSRASSPDGAVGVSSDAQGACRTPSPACDSCASSPAAASDRGKTVTFAGAAEEADGEAADAAASCGEVAAPLRHALTTASSSGWYDELCCVCWESEVTAAMEPCMHALCLGCARQLVGCSGTTAPACPLCRAHITGFAPVPHNARQQAGKRKKSLMAGAGI